MNKRRETVLKDERKKRKSIETEWKGSLTVEASCVMAVVLFSLAALIGKAGQIHDETAAAMVLHEGVENAAMKKYTIRRCGSVFQKECRADAAVYGSYCFHTGKGSKKDGKSERRGLGKTD